MKPQVEILAPAGSYESMVAAIKAGADAVYIGGTRFGARAYADNLTEEKMLEAIDYVHLHGKKIYLTINTLFKEQELREELYSYLLPYYKQGLDAVIVQDLGVLQYIKEQFPDLPIHASTQMTITNVTGAKFLEELGVERVVTSRELQLDEIYEISEGTDLEIESFVHGALCYCYSGQCLYSSLIGGRSGNRGQCAQPCRLPYKVDGQREKSYVLSLKDICTLEHIPKLIEAGIYSFKIEGRMKKPEYVALVTAMYRKYVDLFLEKGTQGFAIDPQDRQNLMDLYNRGGFHSGYYHTKNGREMVSLQRPNHAGVEALKVIRQNGKSVQARVLTDIHNGDVIELPSMENYTFANTAKTGDEITFVTHKKQAILPNQVLYRTRNESLIQDIHNSIINQKLQEKINGNFILSSTDSSKLILTWGDMVVETFGKPMEVALNQPTSKERIEKQLRKTGNTEFEFDELNIWMEEDLFVPMQELNELRRNAIQALEEKILSAYRRTEPQQAPYLNAQKMQKVQKPDMHALVEALEQFEVVCDNDYIKRVYVDCNAISAIWKNVKINEIIERAHTKQKEIFLAMPHIFRATTKKCYEKSYDNLIEADWDGMLVRNIESYVFLKQHNYQKAIVTDHHLYQFNRYSKEFWLNEGVSSLTAPLELNYVELQEVGLDNSELVVYGYLPMMVSAQCVVNTMKGCKKNPETIFIKDRLQKEFAVKNKCDYCYNIIYNTAPLVLTDQKEEVFSLSPKAIRLAFTIEDKKTTEKILNMYGDIFVNDEDGIEPDFAFTRGHFKRGIK